MNREDILRMARQLDVFQYYKDETDDSPTKIVFSPHDLERFAVLVAAEEREACAKTCESIHAYQNDGLDGAFESGAAAGMKWCVEAIRARSQT